MKRFSLIDFVISSAMASASAPTALPPPPQPTENLLGSIKV